MQPIEGLTPGTLWTTIYGLIAICLIFMIVYNVYDAIYKINVRRKERKEAHAPDLADKVSKKILETLEPRFQEIERKLDMDKNRLDNHEGMISSMQETHRDTKEGLSAICKALLVITTYGNIGNNEKVKEASTELANYLADRL